MSFKSALARHAHDRAPVTGAAARRVAERDAAAEHAVRVEPVGGKHQPRCECGWSMPAFASEVTARLLSEQHLAVMARTCARFGGAA